MVKMNVGIKDKDRLEMANGLKTLLADSYSLYLKTHKFHWNVEGPYFQTLHLMFEAQYTELSLAVDTIAERIRALGEYAPGSYKEFAELSSISDSVTKTIANKMVEELLEGHETIIRHARSLLSVAEKCHDEASGGLLAQRIEIHEKTAWMLRSSTK
jgi:starvation-inducible DNA-binding protein